MKGDFSLASPTSNWTFEHLEEFRWTPECTAPVIRKDDLKRAGSIGLWDAWPVLTRSGDYAKGNLWMALAAPWFDDPDERHRHARIHLFERLPDSWRPLGPAMPDGFSPGSREWSGSAFLEPDSSTLTLYFTAAGRRGEARTGFEQRLFEAKATLIQASDGPRLTDWRDLRESVRRDPALYQDTQQDTGSIGTIKAFRDPSYFLDPGTGRHWLFFTASLASSASPYNGVIGAALTTDETLTNWQILPPVISADGLNNELERPHVIARDGLYYLFWSTQSHVFNPSGPVGPTGLYGMVSDELADGWSPLNGSGLVVANPPEAPRQAYSWLVLPDLSVTSFIDDWERGPSAGGERRFGGTFAPFLRLALDGATTRIVD